MPASRPQIHTQYSDISRLLDSCLLSGGGGSYTAPSYNKAVVFRQRCYAFMKKYREAAPEASPYDVLVIRALPAKRLVDPVKPIAVRIDYRQLDGSFVPDQGTEPSLPTTSDEPDLAEAIELRKSLGL